MRRSVTATLTATLATVLALLAPTAATADHPGGTGAVTDRSCSDVAEGVQRCDQVVTSFDGTPISTHLFVPASAGADNPAPLILRGHGYGGSGETTVSGTLARLLDQGWLVLTWDARGHDESGGFIQVDSPAYERRDTEVLIDVFGSRDDVLQESAGDPVVGFTGYSYGGGIQLVTAAFDPRVDALAPEITWNDLRYSLGSIQAGAMDDTVVKDTWIAALLEFGSQPPDRQAPWIDAAAAQGLATNQIDQTTVDRFGFRSYATVYDRSLAADTGPSGHTMQETAAPLTVPTLLMQGSVDTLFNLTEAQHTFLDLRRRGVPTKLFIFCGGVDGGGRTTHGFCPTGYRDAGDVRRGDDLIVAWFRRHLLGDAAADTGAPVEWESNTGEFRTRDDFPTAGRRAPTLRLRGTVVNDGAPVNPGSDLPGQDGEFPGDLERGATAPFAAHPGNPADPGVVESSRALAATDGPFHLVGVPRLRVKVRPVDDPTRLTGSTSVADVIHLFAKLVVVDPVDGSREVVNVQEAALRVEDLDEGAQTFTLDMPGVAYTVPQGHEVRLQIDTTSNISSEAREPSAAQVKAAVRLPVERG